MTRFTRRDAFRCLGISLALPMLESVIGEGLARAETAPLKKRFIGCFFPSGAAMPNGENGDWVLEGAMKPLADKALQPNLVITRGFRAIAHEDSHWSGTASFMSCNELGLRELAAPNRRAGERCGKSFDQYVADLEATKIRSLHAGWNALQGWDEAHDSHLSIQYVNCIAWRDERAPIQNTRNPQEMFVRVFGDGTSVADPKVQYLLTRRKSIMDGVHGQLSSFRKSLAAADRPRMDAYETGIREVELELTANLKANICDGANVKSDVGSTYVRNMRTMQKIIIKAFQCNATRAATIMYNEGIGDIATDGSTSHQHDCAHNNWEELKKINRVQLTLWAELVKELKDAGQLAETVVVLGSNMSDGRSHRSANTPFLLASEGPGLALGKEVHGTTALTDPNANRTPADIYMDLFPLYGIKQAQFGEGKDQSTGKPSGVVI